MGQEGSASSVTRRLDLGERAEMRRLITRLVAGSRLVTAQSRETDGDA